MTAHNLQIEYLWAVVDRPYSPEFRIPMKRREFLFSGLALPGLPHLATSAQAKTETTPLTRKLARFVVSTKYDAIPPKALATAKTAIMDCLGVAVAGSREESAVIAGRLVREERAKEETTIYGQRF